MQAVVYARISRDREGAGLGVDRQRADCEELAARLGWEVAEVYVDNDLSAYSGRRRPGYLAMLDALESGRATGIVTWHTDRLHRSPVELEAFIDLCDRKGVEVQTVQAGTVDLSTASGKMVARMLGAAARHEVEHAIERQKRAKLQAAMDGKFRGGRRSFGYDKSGMALQDDEAAAIRDAIQKVLVGVSLRQICREWQEKGLRTSFGGSEWTARTLKKVLLRPRNAALVTHEGKVIGPAQWPAIIDEDTHRALVALLGDPGRRNSFTTERSALGAGLYLCGICGCHLHTGTQSGSGAPGTWRRVYKCSGSAHLARIADKLDEYVTALVIERLSRPDVALVLGGDEVDLPAMHAKREGLQARLDELAAMFAAGDIDGSQMKRGTQDLRAKLAAADTELAEVRNASALADLVLAGDDLVAVWEGLALDAKSRVVDALMTVTVLRAPRGRQPGGGYFNPEYVQIEWKS